MRQNQPLHGYKLLGSLLSVQAGGPNCPLSPRVMHCPLYLSSHSFSTRFYECHVCSLLVQPLQGTKSGGQ